MFGELIVGYLFLGGAGSAALAMLGGRECVRALRSENSFAHRCEEMFARRRTLEAENDVHAWLLCLLFLGVGAVFLITDLGRPDRILQVIYTPQLSVVTVGTFALGGCVACAAVFSADRLLDAVSLRRGIRIGLGALSVVLGFVCAAYTGVLLQNMASVVFWQTPLLPVLFTVSSFSCGTMCVAMGLVLGSGLDAPAIFVRRAAIADAVLIGLEALILSCYLIFAVVHSQAHSAAMALLSGDLSSLFWIGVVVVGLAAPILLEASGACSKNGSIVCLCAIAVLAGGVALRICMVEASLFDVTNVSEVIYGFSISGIME